MLSQATQTPIVSVNLSIARTVLMRPGDCSAISDSQKLKQGRISALRSQCKALLFSAGLCGPALHLRPVIVGRERIRRKVKALGGHHDARIAALRIKHLLEERVL